MRVSNSSTAPVGVETTQHFLAENFDVRLPQMLAVAAGQVMDFDSAQGHAVPSQKRILLEQVGRWLMLNAKQIDLAGKWSQLVATSRREADFLQINESQSIRQWPAAEIETQIKMNELPPKPIYDSSPKGAKIQIVSLCHGNE